jgi:hypothetical protein
MAVSMMFDTTLTGLKGWPSPVALDFTAKFDAAVTLNPVPAGVVVHLNGSGKFELGAQLLQMPLFLIQNSTDFDVANAGGNNWTAVAPAGNVTGLVATGGYELETTAFDTAQTYAPNDHLTSVISNSASNGGSLTNQSLGVLYAASGMTNRCGVVSRGKYTNAYGKTVLAFWPIYLPGNA